jgi:hypothetical protein
VTSVEWEPLLRRLTQSHSFLHANTSSTWITAAAPIRVLDILAGLRVERAVTGSCVTPAVAPDIAVICAADPERLGKTARLLPVTTGSNVILAAPYEPIVFQRARDIDGRPVVSVVQAAIDPLTGPGRMPVEGKALLTRMRRNERRWRNRDLKG